MFLPDSWKLPPEIAPEWLWVAFLIIGLGVSVSPLVLGIKLYRQGIRFARLALYSGVALSIAGCSFVASFRPIVAKGWQWVVDGFSTLPSASEVGTSFIDSVTPVVVSGLGVGVVLFIVYVVMEEF